MIELKNINKKFNNKIVLNQFSLEVKQNEFVAITGNSGSGKTTILNIIGLLETIDSGSIKIKDFENPNKKEIKELRRYNFGYIFQNYALLEEESVKNNLKIASKYNENFEEKDFIKVLKEVGLKEDILNESIYKLSGGEQQRVAIARMLIKPCDIILADEPTGNLDEENSKSIVRLLRKMQNNNKTIICVTHDMYLAHKADRIISLD